MSKNANYQTSFQEKRTNIIIKFKSNFLKYAEKFTDEEKQDFLSVFEQKELQYLNKLPDEVQKNE